MTGTIKETYFSWIWTLKAFAFSTLTGASIVANCPIHLALVFEFSRVVGRRAAANLTPVESVALANSALQIAAEIAAAGISLIALEWHSKAFNTNHK